MKVRAAVYKVVQATLIFESEEERKEFERWRRDNMIIAKGVGPFSKVHLEAEWEEKDFNKIIKYIDSQRAKKGWATRRAKRNV